MSGQTYPYTAWVLTRNFAVIEVQLVGRTGDGQHERTLKGKWYTPDALFKTHEDAIQAGRARIRIARAEIARKAAVLEERSASLDKVARRQ
ncbi:MAG TPA: hypothetical protein VGC62_07660 [Pseudomonas sp.]|uniref:hypothetical protein n=1 Tax=Pseudomonas sp. TaxID=306 RepID=UPI002ED89379